jgi:rSAM/selenodomain-associated transferase 2
MNDHAKISIIIPTLNEAANIEKSIASIPISQQIEVMIVDGGSRDQTIEIAQRLGVKILSATGGRAIQMNVGAGVATGEILLFLHADTLLPAGFATMVQTALASKDLTPIAGAFALRIDAPQWRLRLIEWGVNWRSRFGKMPYGDQAIFLTAETFQQLGGFPELPIMEDFQLMWQLGKLGRIEIISTPVITSARRWQQRGILQTTLVNQMMIIGYLCGVSPTQLSCWYRDRSKLSLSHWWKILAKGKNSEI